MSNFYKISLAITLSIIGTSCSDSTTETTNQTISEATVSQNNATADQETETIEPNTVNIEILDGNVKVEPEELNVEKNSTVYINAKSDVEEDIHIHGYDIHLLVPEQGDNSTSFVASKPGKFEIELEESAYLLLNLSVN